MRRGGSSQKPPPPPRLVRIILSRAGAACGAEVFEQAEVIIGRDPSCDLVLWGLEVSRRHARIVQQGAELLLEDLGSRRGLTVNGQATRRCPLHSGDRIAIGTFALTLELPVQAAARAPAADEDEIVTEVNSGLRTPAVK